MGNRVLWGRAMPSNRFLPVLTVVAGACVLWGGDLAACPGGRFVDPPAAEPTEATESTGTGYGAGMAAIEAGDYEQALAIFRSLVDAAPEDADALTQLGYTHLRLQNYDQAFGFYRRALEIDPEHAGAHGHIGKAYVETGEIAKAEDHLRALDLICLFGCDAFYSLKEAIDLYRINQSS